MARYRGPVGKVSRRLGIGISEKGQRILNKRAFPPGHPDLAGTDWEKTGHPCLVPGSMLAGAALVVAAILAVRGW
jgi:hypothetical protein